MSACSMSNNMRTKEYIRWLANLSDAANKAKKEMEVMVAAARAISPEEHEAIKALLLGIQSDAGLADSIRFENYERISDKHFAVR